MNHDIQHPGTGSTNPTQKIDQMTQEEIDGVVSESELLRSNFASCQGAPTFTFNRLKIGVNAACVRKAMDHDYIQILINREKKLLIVHPCEEEDIHSFRWCTWKDGKKYPRQITAKIFYMKICDLMGWNPEDRYRIIGKFVHSKGQEMCVFDLPAAETFHRIATEDGKAETSHTPTYPLAWKDQFGIPYEGHQKALQINLFDGYAVYSVNDGLTESPVPPALLSPGGILPPGRINNPGLQNGI